MASHARSAGSVTGGLVLLYNENFFSGIASDENRFRAYAQGAEKAFEAGPAIFAAGEGTITYAP